MKYVSICALFFASNTFSGSIYQCTNENGDVIFQSLPCEDETVKVVKEEPKFTNEEFTSEMIRALSQLSGESESDLMDLEIRKAAELLAATDAAKSYAYTQVYSVAAKHCGQDVRKALATYSASAKGIIELGHYYYQNGIQSNIKGQDIGHSGEELTRALDEMLNDLDRQYGEAGSAALKKICSESNQALNMLTSTYGR